MTGGARSGKPVLGHEIPRVFTPPRRKLTPQTSAGFAAIKFAEYLHDQVVGTKDEELVPPLLPWERWFLIHALELNPNGSYRFKLLLLWVARQNGKTFVAAIMILFRMFMDGDAQVLGVAQKLATAKKPWKQAKKIIAAVPRLKQEFARESGTNGELWFELTGEQSYWVDSADNGGRGLTFDFVFIDEILKHKTFSSWSALSKTTNARRRAQILAAGNTGALDAVVQRHLHKQAMDAIEAGDASTSIGLFWWSPPDGAPADDPATWAYGNPSLGYTIEADTLAGDYSTDPAPVFLAEVMNRFPDDSSGGPFHIGTWARQRDPLSKRASPETPVYLCIEVSHNLEWTHIAFAAERDDGDAHVGVMKSRPGTDWLVPWLTSPDRKFPIGGITLQSRGAPASSLIPELEAAGFELTEWQGPDLGIGTGMLLNAVHNCKAWHRDQPVLDVAAGPAVVKKLGDVYVPDRVNSPGDASPLMGVIGAHWLMRAHPTAGPSVYEERGLIAL
ncbi:terminase large subunit [Rathayibacter sp. Leaf248]|uniref:terminase large subunit n=1 Tax=Rathayibacter sp. Leaf248 TaxID=2876555 RepID=UPI001E4E1D95|nr:terminase large subunit [Rathayibacter sp. Leaf248]